MRPPYTGSDLAAMTACEVTGLLARREVSPQELIEASLARTADTEPAINAMPTLCPDRARAHAERLRTAPAEAGPGCLHGLPVSIKDLTAVAGVTLTCGTPGLAGFVPAESDPLVERMEARGGIVMGKTNTPEFGAGGNTFNAVFGPTRNPWDTGLNPGGSSGGAAAGLAAGQVWLAEGSDHGGSLRTPAAYCGIVGLRPSPGRAGGGTREAAFGLEGVHGPMARTVEDCALLLDTMTGFDPRQPLSIAEPAHPFRAAVQEARPGFRVAFAPDLGGFAPVEAEVRDMLAAAMQALEGTGTLIEEAAPDTSGLYETYTTLRAFGQASGPGQMPEAVQAHYKQTLRDNIAAGRALTVDDVMRANRARSLIYHRTREFLLRYDVIACPVVGLPAQPCEVEYPRSVDGRPMADYVDWLRFAYLATMCTLPAISVPIGLTAAGTPMGLQLIGQPRGEAALLAAARVLEQAVGFGHRPIDPVTR
ncbi:amidase [Oceanicella sp. SM1341]|uniref:amidase n=1 Tax=Oceanicella sp. SM1341 TaxID=1548889 RepID=UPI001E2AF591|nr:amidase family protein [Oceanicella sp. SM1341]